MWWDSQVLLGLLVLLLLGQGGVWLSRSQEVVVQGGDCVNGRVVKVNQTAFCECFPGWSGPQCAFCRGRIRLTESSGILTDDALNMHYESNTQCLFYIQADQSVSSIHLKIHLLHLECQWDYLYVFDGDSLFAQKLACYTGNIVEEPPVNLPMLNETLEEEDLALTSILNPQHTLSSSGPEVLLYFYSDEAQESPGFELAYWLEYECPDLCSEQGVCNNSTGRCWCDPGWTGDACHIPVCPRNCSGKGACDKLMERCVCDQGFQGDDCSVDMRNAHWSTVSHSGSPPHSTLARASHSAVLWEGSMIVYGGYRFPEEGSYFEVERERGRGGGAEPVEDDLLRYWFDSGTWEVLNTTASVTMEEREDDSSGEGNVTLPETPGRPAPRYGHSAVIYNNSMYVFGGALYPSETITSELWALNLTSLEWTPLFSASVDNSTERAEGLRPPVPVRGHTAHVVGSKMVVLWGISPGQAPFPAYIQEYDFRSGVWSLAVQRGVPVAGRVGHASVYSEKEGLIYVHGGRNVMYATSLLSYDPVCGTWAQLTSSTSVRYLHSAVMFGPMLVVFGGCQGHSDTRDCFSNDLLLYNTLCDSWETLELPGLLANASRYGHTSLVAPQRDGVGGEEVVVFGGFIGTLRSDMLRLVVGNCSQWKTEEDCVNGTTSLCAWRSPGLCVSVGEVQPDEKNVSFLCEADPCALHGNATACDVDGCMWSDEDSRCLSEAMMPSCSPSDDPPAVNCSQLGCQSCQLYDSCVWGMNHSDTQQMCFFQQDLEDPSLNITVLEECNFLSCFARDSCSSCTSSGCLWCPSLSQCIPGNSLYNVVYNYGQCLGWRRNGCDQALCEQRTNCSSCQELSECGWCNDPSDTGLGQCRLGGFGGSRNESLCQIEGGSSTFQEEWQFDQCSACQCNGHSTCANGSSVCEQCMDNTEGENCQTCSVGYFGNPHNGQSCADCDCNGYDLACDVVTGACVCHGLGVSGDHCENCTGDYGNGDADNFCYASLMVGFIYTFMVTDANEVQGFYSVTPNIDESLHVRFEMSKNPSGMPVYIQLFVGRHSENLWLLVNITEELLVPPLGFYDTRLDDFSKDNETFLSSFAHPSIRSTDNFTQLLEEARVNDYTNHMWDGDVSLVLRVSQLNHPSEFKITVDQENYIYLLYFFATFITCFSVLLTALLVGWFIKKKLAMRAYMRRQYIELQRRVARPFTKIMLAVDNTPLSTTSPSLPIPDKQNPSYVGVEACRDDKAAILSLMVQLPRDPKTGYPSHGRTGLCLGSTLVYVNSSKKPKKKKGRSQKEEPQGGGRVGSQSGSSGSSGGGSIGGSSSGENQYVIRTGRARHRNLGGSQPPAVQTA